MAGELAPVLAADIAMGTSIGSSGEDPAETLAAAKAVRLRPQVALAAGTCRQGWILGGDRAWGWSGPHFSPTCSTSIQGRRETHWAQPRPNARLQTFRARPSGRTDWDCLDSMRKEAKEQGWWTKKAGWVERSRAPPESQSGGARCAPTILGCFGRIQRRRGSQASSQGTGRPGWARRLLLLWAKDQGRRPA